MKLSDLLNSEAPVWVSGKTYTVGQTVRAPGDWYFKYVRFTAGAGTTDPSSDTANWRPDGARPVKSIQRGSVSISSYSDPTGVLPITISAVNPAKTEVRFLGGSGYFNSSATMAQLAYLTLTNSTTLTATCTRNGHSFNVMISWELTEYY